MAKGHVVRLSFASVGLLVEAFLAARDLAASSRHKYRTTRELLVDELGAGISVPRSPVGRRPRRRRDPQRVRREATRQLAATLTEDQFTQRRREGEAMDLDDAVAYALAEIDNTLTNSARRASPNSP